MQTSDEVSSDSADEELVCASSDESKGVPRCKRRLTWFSGWGQSRPKPAYETFYSPWDRLTVAHWGRDCKGGGGVKRPRQQPAQPPIRQLLGAADAQAAHPATFSTAPAHQLLGSANAETTPAGAPAAAADRTQRPDATCEEKSG